MTYYGGLHAVDWTRQSAAWGLLTSSSAGESAMQADMTRYSVGVEVDAAALVDQLATCAGTTADATVASVRHAMRVAVV
jgi:uncharacterized protein YggE